MEDCRENIKGSLERQIKLNLRTSIYFIVLAAFSAFVFVEELVMTCGIISIAIRFGLPFIIGVLIVIICCLVMCVWHFVTFITINKRKPAPRLKADKTVKAQNIFRFGIALVAAVSLITVIVSYVSANRGPDIIPLSEYREELNFPKMEIEETEYSDAFISKGSCYVAPTYIWLRQYGFGGDTKNYGYNCCYYEMRTSTLASSFEIELQSKAQSLEAIEASNFESATYYIDADGENIILRLKNVIITFLYYGPDNLQDVVGDYLN